MADTYDVAVTGPRRRLKLGWWATRFMVRASGLTAVHLMPGRHTEPVRVRGVVIGGGDNIDPVHYGAEGDGLAEYDVERDNFEIDILRRVLETPVPVLGICRGAQLVNVVLGGTLYQDLRPLRKRTPNRNSAFPVKNVILEPTSRLAACMQTEWTRVNSLHHQAVHHLADGLQSSAWDSDGFIQGVESPTKPFLLGVQWHPEYLPYKRAQRALFRAFAATVRDSGSVIRI